MSHETHPDFDDVQNASPLPDWLDPDSQALAELSAEDRRRLGDHLWMESLLIEAHRPTGATAREVEDHLARWNQKTQQASPKTTTAPNSMGGPAIPATIGRHWLFSAISVSAALASVFVFWSISSGTTPTAQAAFSQAKQRAVELVDRTYQIRFVLPQVPAISAELYLRGPDQLALRVSGPAENSTWIGTTRERSWLVPAIGPVLVANDFQPVLEHFARSLRLPRMSLRISDVLNSIENDYSLELAGDEMIPAFGSLPARRIIATKREGFRPLLPMKVTLWTHPDTGVVGRLVLEWSDQLETVAVRQVTFELTDQNPQADNWYDHASHHQANQPVMILDRPANKKGSPSISVPPDPPKP
jgi:hypothetical protein